MPRGVATYHSSACYVYHLEAALAQKTRASEVRIARDDIFRKMPPRSFAVFCLAVACTFAAVGVVNDLFDLEHSDVAHLLTKILSTSSFAVLWVLLVYRRALRLLILIAALQITWFIVAPHLSPPRSNVFTSSEWRVHIAIHACLIIVFVLFSYGWFGTFFRMEARRYYAAHTEIELASRIQQELAPPISMTDNEVEVFGTSMPSGSVGGDLIDALKVDGSLCFMRPT